MLGDFLAAAFESFYFLFFHRKLMVAETDQLDHLLQ